MGYDIHITRKPFYFDETGEEISLDEWKEFVHQDSEMRLDNFAEFQMNNGQILHLESEGLAVWIAYSKHGLNTNMAWFSWSNGCIHVKNPDHEILKKMWRIAQRLSADVQGDEGEFYDVNGNVVE
ncbi:hypothetical protein [Acinetobacter junii]|uniref:hypothetical protein n=1 Tax=Acinetobacter junii TaxID=40215 RepID=UPI000F65C7A2|nr:hypothetical protein [Acinetobacter junii]RSE35599.1 hypothetical protein EGT62_03295 [Acinetobacter junii]